jgi:hypothetical protein
MEKIRLQVLLKYKKTSVVEVIAKFEALHGISYIMKVVDGSYILIIAPYHDLAYYYNCKGFYSILLQ